MYLCSSVVEQYLRHAWGDQDCSIQECEHVFLFFGVFFSWSSLLQGCFFLCVAEGRSWITNCLNETAKSQ